MADLIDRQMAIDSLGEEPPVWYDGDDEIAERNQWERDVNAIKALPPAQPERTEERTETHECDLISRQAAIEKIDRLMEIHFDRKVVLWKVRDAIENLTPVTERTGHWIPVTEKLPPKGADVIVTDIETVETYVGYYVGEGYWDTDNGPCRDRIVAWMPLPEPYREGGDN